MTIASYFGQLREIIGDEDAIEREKARLDSVIQKASQRLKSAISPRTASSLIWCLAFKEHERVAPLVGLPLSDFAGQARFLRALAAATQFESGDIGDDPKVDQLLEWCGELWWALIFRELMDDLKQTDRESLDTKKRRVGAFVSLFGALQLETAYIEQAEQRTTALFSQFSREVVEPKLNLSVQDAQSGFKLVRDELTARFDRVRELMQPLRQEFHESDEQFEGGFDRAPDPSDPRIVGLVKSYQKGAELLNRFYIFTPSDLRPQLGERAKTFFDAFSFVPGRINQELKTPFDTDAVRARPFARLEGEEFLLFDPFYCSFAPLYRLQECFENDAVLRQRLFRQRDKVLETDASRLLTSIIGESLSLAGYYAPVGKNGAFAERDLLFFRDGTLILCECKAKPLRRGSEHRGSVRKIEGDIKVSIQAAYDQACSVWKYVSDSGTEAMFFDSDKPNRQCVASLRRDVIREVHVVVFLDSYYGLVGTDLDLWLTPDPAVGFPWVVDRDTCESIGWKINTSEKLTDFLRWRKTVHGKAWNEDEAVFAGYFVQHGSAPFPENATIVHLVADYADVFELEYFRSKGFDVELPEPPSADPAFMSIRKDGNRIFHELNGEIADVLDLNEQRPIPALAVKHVGRNDQCPCGSGQKFKKCCLPRLRTQ